MTAIILSLLLLNSVLSQVEKDAAAPAAEERLHLQFLKEQTAALLVYRADDRRSSLTITAEPVLRYSNPLGGGQAGSGATFLWLDGTRPLAAVSLSTRPADNHVYLECTSLVAAPLVCLRNDAPFWSPTTVGRAAQRLENAPDPADTKNRRLSQMREIVRRFSAASYTQTDVRTELRLLTTPIYRFADDVSGVLDGALFAFAVSNDPELFVLLEAVREARGGAAATWQYSLARMSSRKEVVRLDDRDIWTTENFYSRPLSERKTGPYLEARLGTFDPATGAVPTK